ncbi:MAG: Sir2 family NAD-dependent protein deacetylase [Thermoplasmata archaeon]
MNRELSFQERVTLAAEWIRDSRKLVVFTGAGISTESGVPDYRGPDGVWTRRDKGLPPPPMPKPPWECEPNLGHFAIVELERMGKLDLLISQNIDNLHLKSGISPEKLVELHGNATLLRCLECDRLVSKREAGWDDRRHGRGYRTDPPLPGQPLCSCGGRLISSVVNFGDPMPRRELERAYRHSSSCDLFIVVGSSLVVSPAADMPLCALRSGARLVIINKGDTPFDALADLRFYESAGKTLSAILDKLRLLETR